MCKHFNKFNQFLDDYHNIQIIKNKNGKQYVAVRSKRMAVRQIKFQQALQCILRQSNSYGFSHPDIIMSASFPDKFLKFRTLVKLE